MNFADVQTYASERLKADARLTPYGEPLIYSPFVSDEDARAHIRAAIDATGVCFEIGAPEAEANRETPNPRFNAMTATFDLFIAESLTVTHALSGMELVKVAAEAMQARAAVKDQNARCISYVPFQSEQGYVLHVLTFSIPVIL